MAIIRGPKIVRSGLVLALDAADKNSYLGSGTAWKDISGNNNNATLTSGPTFSSDKGGCIVFDGVNNYAQVSNSSSLNSSSQTISVWYNASSTPGRPATIIGKHDLTGSQNGYNVWTGNSTEIKVANTAYDAGPATGIASVWYFLTLAYTANANMICYVNGISLGTTAIGNLAISSNVLRIGISVDSFWSKFTGKIAKIDIYNRQLSSVEILQNYITSKSRFGL
jgi:hypothetical protein